MICVRLSHSVAEFIEKIPYPIFRFIAAGLRKAQIAQGKAQKHINTKNEIQKAKHNRMTLDVQPLNF